MVSCPVECLDYGEPDFIERNGAWVLTVVGVGVGCIGTLLTYFLKSRCSKIACCGLNCERDVVKLEPFQIQVMDTSSNRVPTRDVTSSGD